LKVLKTKKHLIITVALAFSTILVAGCMQEAKSGAILAKVGNETITQSQIDNRYNSMSEDFKTTSTQKENKEVILQQLINEQVLLSEAKKEGYEKHQDFKTQLSAIDKQVSDLKKETLINLLLRDKLNTSQTTDKEIQESYSTNIDLFKEYELRRASHILVPTKEEAVKLHKKLKNGQSFTVLAKKYSKDATAEKGGDLGWVRKGQIKELPKFDKTLFTIKKKGSISTVVKTQLGFHIIKLTDIKVIPKQTFASVKEKIKKSITTYKQNQAIVTYVDSLKTNYKVSISEKNEAEQVKN
jgi:peptidyl-prolyl cis-trans isomerase C